ncbi:MAG: hypothetical protein OXU64_03805 [Gemmatimonadota bacterium]|nr:hypothetical protein [Gemmatimonadota bacterium]
MERSTASDRRRRPAPRAGTPALALAAVARAPRACLPPLPTVAAGLVFATGGLPPAGVAQQLEGVRARMEYDRIVRYSGPGRNLSVLRQRAHARVSAMRGSGMMRMGGAGLRWRPLGPERRAYGSFMVTGRVTAIAVHPEDNDIVYAGGAQGGVWKSEDAGGSWTPLTDRECSLAMGSIAIDPVDPEIVYAGTGEQNYQRDSYYGCGVLRTLDGGATWEQLGADPFVRKSATTGGAYIARVVVDRATAGSSDSTAVLVASSFGLYRSTSSGESWKLVLEGRATDLLAHPSDSTVFFAAVQENGVYKSEDSGETWDETSTGMSLDGAKRINLAISLSDTDVLYATVETDDSEGRGLRMYRTGDGADTWEQVDAAGAPCDYRCYYTNAVAVHPEDPDRVTFGSVRLYRSDDGGESFEPLSGVPYVDEQLLVLDTLRDSDAIYLANDGGVHRSLDAGDSWTSLASNLAVIQFYRGIALHPSDPGVTLGGTQDQGTLRSSPGSMVWTQVIGGDGGYNAFDAEDPRIWYGEVYWIPGWGTGGPRKNGRLATRGMDLTEPGLFLPPLVMDPVDSRRLYFGTRSLYRTVDAADRWERIYRTSSDDEVITAIAPAPSDSNTVYAGVLYGQVVVTRDGGLTWHSGSGLPDRFIRDLAVHPDDPEQAYAVAGGFLTGHVFHTTDGGRSWRDRSGGLPDHPVHAVLYDPADPSAIYVGTDFGVFRSARGGESWDRLDEGLPMVAVFDLAAQPGTGRLVAGTHGRGMFEIPIEVPLSLRTRPGAIADTIRTVADTIAGTMIVAPRGKDDHAASWEAASGVPWLAVSDAAGRGRGRFRYELSGEGLNSGLNETRLEVTLAGVGGAFEIPVSLYAPPLRIPELRRTEGFGVAGWSLAPPDSLPPGITGFGADTAVWSAESSGPGWLVVERAEGRSDQPVVWSRDTEGLEAGVYEDTITVTVRGRPEAKGRIADRVEVAGSIGVEDAALHLLGADRLDGGQVRFLDWFGNRDGTLNAGDALRWLDHCSGGGAGSGCGSGNDTRRSRDDSGIAAKGPRREL